MEGLFFLFGNVLLSISTGCLLRQQEGGRPVDTGCERFARKVCSFLFSFYYSCSNKMAGGSQQPLTTCHPLALAPIFFLFFSFFLLYFFLFVLFFLLLLLLLPSRRPPSSAEKEMKRFFFLFLFLFSKPNLKKKSTRPYGRIINRRAKREPWPFTEFFFVRFFFRPSAFASRSDDVLKWVLLGFTEFRFVSLGLTSMKWVLLGFTWFFLVLLSYTGFRWFQSYFTWSYWV